MNTSHVNKFARGERAQSLATPQNLADKRVFIFGPENRSPGTIADELHKVGATVIFSKHSPAADCGPTDYAFPKEATDLVAEEIRIHKPDLCLVITPLMDSDALDLESVYLDNFQNHPVVGLARRAQTQNSPMLIYDVPELSEDRRRILKAAGADYINYGATNDKVLSCLSQMVADRPQGAAL